MQLIMIHISNLSCSQLKPVRTNTVIILADKKHMYYQSVIINLNLKSQKK